MVKFTVTPNIYARVIRRLVFGELALESLQAWLAIYGLL